MKKQRIETVKYWKDKYDDLVIYLDKEIKSKADKLIRQIDIVINDTKNKI